MVHSIAAHEIHVENFMVRNIRFIWEKMTHEELEEILKENPKIHSFPLVQCPGVNKFQFLECSSRGLTLLYLTEQMM